MMIRRRILLSGLLAGTALAAAPARAASEAKFDPAAFAAAQKAGKPILVEVHAPWCPTCAKQKPILGKLGAEPANKELVRFVVDFDSQKEVLATLNVRMQSTLIAFRGSQEMGRSVGVTDEAQIKALVDKTRG
jgi:thioredoxin-like negative regulator of GroEL